MEYNKYNAVLLLITIIIQRKESAFIGVLINDLDAHIPSYNADNETSYEKISRSTFYNYLSELEELLGENINREDVHGLTQTVLDKHDTYASKIFKKINKVIYERVQKFLVDHGYLKLEEKDYIGVKGTSNFYHSFCDFLGTSFDDHEYQRYQLVGGYKVFRPSLSNPGKILVTCANIECFEDGPVRYQELMHFEDIHGWRRQILGGYVVSKNKDIAIITKDTNTLFSQVSFLKPLLTEPDKNKNLKVKQLSGLYNGISTNPEIGVYSTGIYFVRVNLRNVGKYPVHKWKTGWIKKYFGLQEKDNIEPKILKYMTGP